MVINVLVDITKFAGKLKVTQRQLTSVDNLKPAARTLLFNTFRSKLFSCMITLARSHNSSSLSDSLAYHHGLMPSVKTLIYNQVEEIGLNRKAIDHIVCSYGNEVH